MRHLMAIAVLAGGLSARAALAQESGPEERLGEARTELLSGLEEYAAWCTAERLYAERGRIWRLVLEIDPEHGEAHRGLGHKKGSRGNWIVPKKIRAVKNYDEGPLDEAPERYAAAVEPFVGCVLALLAQPDLSSAGRASGEKELLRFDPDNATVREMRGEVRSARGWVLRETETSIRRREELAAVAFEGFADPNDVEEIELDEKERGFVLTFHAVGSPDVRVLATGSVEEATEMERAMHAAELLFEHAFDTQTSLPRGCTIYLLGRAGEKEAFLELHPAVSADQRGTFARLDGLGVPDTADWAHWASDEAKRRDAIVHMSVAWFLMDAFQIGIEHGWAFEGFGLYLTKVVTGTRLTWFVTAEAGVDPRESLAMRSRLLDPATNWMQEARALLAGGDASRLAQALRKRTDELGVADLLCCYAFAAYLAEGRPDEVPELLRLVGAAGQDPEPAVVEALGADLDTIQGRLVTWIEQSGATEVAAPVDAARLHTAWAALDDESKRQVSAAFRRRIERLDTGQLRAMRRLVAAQGDAPAGWPLATDAPHYDPKKHSPADPIRRRRLAADHPAVESVLLEFYGAPNPRELVSSFRYDWGTGEIVRTGDPADDETIFANAANGYAPGLDLARAVVMRELDRGEECAVLAAFGHAYTDREGGVYPGTTLFDAWKSKETIEMPDVDVLGIVHDVLDEWQRWKAPISASEHHSLYARIERLFRRARDYREPREVLADTYLIGEPVDRRGYGDALTNLQALWAARRERIAKLADELPEAAGWPGFLAGWVESCKSDPDLWNAGRQREFTLSQDAERVRAVLVEAMQEVGVLGEASAAR